MNVQHSSRSDTWYTPAYIIALVREVLGPIDLDPASDSRANAVVQASSYLTESDDGLVQPWGSGSIYLNPPGGKKGNKSLAGLFWARLMEHRHKPDFKHAIFMAFSAEALQNTQGKSTPSIMEFAICVPSKRVRFVYPGVEKSSPSHSNVVVYVPGYLDETDRFLSVFKTLGACKR